MKNFYFLLICFLPQWTAAQVFYSNVAPAAGINHSYGPGTPGAGASFCDFDNDGWDDLTLATTAGSPIRFYKNMDGSFTELSPLVNHQDRAKQVLWVDFDNDGDKDLYVATFGAANRLYENTGDLTFTDITQAAGLPVDNHRTFGACWGDYDRDGWLDLYYGERKFPPMILPNENRLFRNNADGTFTEVTQEAGVTDPGKQPFCSGFLDYNNDGWPDIFTANDKGTINTLLGNNGDGTFTDISESTQTNLAMDAMNVATGDYNNDGWLDIYVSNTEGGSALLHNNGATAGDAIITFDNVGLSSGAGFAEGIGWGANFLDADNDGFEDIYISGTKVGSDVLSSAFYQNAGDGTFLTPDAGFVGDTVMSFTNAIGDFNQDGYPDIIVNNHAPFNSQLWQNAGGDHHWIKLRLEGVLSNRDGIGVRIEVFTGAHYQMHYTRCGSGFLAQNSNTQIFGTGTAAMVDSIRVTWPTGHVDRLFEVDAGQTVTLMEGSTTGGDISVDPDVDLTIVGTDDLILQETSIILSPNPSGDFIELVLPEGSFDHYLLLNVKGQVVGQGNLHASNPRINVRRLPEGVYFLAVMGDNGERVVKQWVKG